MPINLNHFNTLLHEAANDPCNVRTPENWRQLLINTRERANLVTFRNFFRRRNAARLACHMNFYAPLGAFKANGAFTVSVRLSGLHVGNISGNINQPNRPKIFTPKLPKQEVLKVICRNAWDSKNTSESWDSAVVFRYLSALSTARNNGNLRDIQREHWVESELLLLVNNRQAIRNNVNQHRGPLAGMSHIGLGASELNKLPFQMSVPIIFNSDNPALLINYPKGYPKPARSFSGGHIDALAYKRGEIQIWEVKDPSIQGNHNIDEDAWQAIYQAYAYTVYLAAFGGDPLRRLTPIQTPNVAFRAVAVVPNNPILIESLKENCHRIQEYENAQHRNIKLGILSFSGEAFLDNREIRDLNWEAI